MMATCARWTNNWRLSMSRNGRRRRRSCNSLRAEGASFFELALETSRQQHRYFSELGQPAEKGAWLEEVARESLEQQARLEADSHQSFAEYLREYFAQV